MPRCAGQIDEVEEVRRLVYVSWLAGDALAAKVQEKLMVRLRLPDYDDAGRELQVVANDPTAAAGEESAQARALRDLANDFVGIFTTGYLARTKELGKAGDPDLFFFVERKCKLTEVPLAMWIFPVEAVELRRVSFKEAAIRSLAFPWWHGWCGDNDEIPLPDRSLRSEQDFDNDMRRRVGQLLAHAAGCADCQRQP